MKDSTESLIDSIRAKCQRQHWYGPDNESPAQLRSLLGEDGDGAFFWYDSDRKKYAIRKDTDISLLPVPSHFEHSPATKEQLLATKELLGFPLPLLLHELYTQLANGGFGPGYGLNGVIGGFGDMVDGYLSCRKTLRMVDFTIYEKLKASTDLIRIPDYVWPDRFLSLCHWGCAVYSFIDAGSGRIFRGAFCSEKEFGFEYEATSMMEWLELWTEDKLQF